MLPERVMPRSIESQMKLIREEEGEMLAGQRGSRLSKWIQSTQKIRDKAGLPAPESLVTLG